MAVKDLHSALKTEVIREHQAGGVNYALVRLQYSKTEVSYSIHACPTSFSISGLQRPVFLEYLGFRASNCSFVTGGKCFAREVNDGFDVEGFSEAFTDCFNALAEADKHFQQCGIYIVKDTGPKFFLKTASGDGHTSPKVQRMKSSEDEVFRYVLTSIEGGRDEGWTIHYRPQHLPLSAELEAALKFLEKFKPCSECPEYDFEQCYWRFIPFEKLSGTLRGSNVDLAHQAFDAHAAHFALALEKLLAAHAKILPYGMNVLPSSNAVVQKTPLQKPPPPPIRKSKHSTYKYDVALSLAGTERELAETLANILREHGVEVFYDRFYPEHLWGKDLAVEFDKIYRKQSRYCVIFVSHEYANRMWTIHERRSALARFLEDRGKEYILPIKVEDVDLDGLPPTIGYLALSSYPIEKVADILLKKLES